MSFLSKIKAHFNRIEQIAKADQKSIDQLFARVFQSDDGQKILAYLHHITTNRAMGAQVSEEQLRHFDGQRALVQMIQKLADRGRQS